MYLERIEGENAAYLHGVARFPFLPPGRDWWDAYKRRIAAAAGLEGIAGAFRIVLKADGSVERLFSATVEEKNEAMLRRFLGGLGWLEGLADYSVALPATQEEFESWTADFPPLRRAILPPELAVASDTWLACDFRVAEVLDSLMTEAASFGFTLGYQVHFRPFRADAEQMRQVGRNLLRLQNAAGMPATLLADQKRQAERFRTAPLLVDEIVGTDGEDAAKWLTAALARRFNAAPARAAIAPPPFEPVAEAAPDLALMMPASLLYGEWTGEDLLCSQAADESFRTATLAIRPAVDPMRGGARPPPPGGASEPPPPPFPPDLDLPPPFEGPDHVFISYRRSDLKRIAPILERLCNSGLPIWYDRGIEGGEEWNAVLERKVLDAAMVLIFLSQATVESKYCRREINLADAESKPLLAVVLERVDLKHGLRFTLQHLQEISIADREFETQLDRAVRRILGERRAEA